MAAVLGIIVALAVLAWCVAVWAAICVVTLSPPGEKLHNYFRLGWWRFAAIEAAAGPAVTPHIGRYKLAFLVFFICILAGAALAVLSAS